VSHPYSGAIAPEPLVLELDRRTLARWINLPKESGTVLIYPGDFASGADLFHALDCRFRFAGYRRPHQSALVSIAYRSSGG
jgi:hypothetical protein